ncbi:MAG: VRR-NUC domain-containing protein [Actinobacteria bacterium]|nr:VRR-NUC domain-containing protein [Actinomycetota bacterium]
MRESTIEKHFVAKVKALGGVAYKFTSPAHRGVADRVVCLPDGSTWFVELKAPGGRLSELQKIFQSDMARMNQKYACLWSKEHVDEWLKSVAS